VGSDLKLQSCIRAAGKKQVNQSANKISTGTTSSIDGGDAAGRHPPKAIKLGRRRQLVAKHGRSVGIRPQSSLTSGVVLAVLSDLNRV
jgi:hypothetical protein